MWPLVLRAALRHNGGVLPPVMWLARVSPRRQAGATEESAR
jgi:hypothetical protein